MAEHAEKVSSPRHAAAPSLDDVAGSAAPSFERGSPDGNLTELSDALNRSPRVQALAQLQRAADRSPRVMQLAALAESLQGRPAASGVAQRRAAADADPQGDHDAMRGVEVPGEDAFEPVQRAAEPSLAGTAAAPVAPPNRTGLPDGLKAGIEARSGLSLDDVRVHRDSDKPAQLQALAYAQGTEIHLGPRQEHHLAHEAWHVVQQKQGRVRPTLQMRGVAIDDSPELEREADYVASVPSPTTRHPIAPGGIAPASGDVRDMPIQRKVNFSGFRDHHYLPEIYAAIRQAFTRDADILLSYLGPERFNILKGEVESETDLTSLIVRLNRSPLDYGEINLENPQHALLLFLDFEKFTGVKYSTRMDDEKEAGEAKKIRAEKWKADLADQEEGDRKTTYDVAFLGAGAAVAYYLTAQGRGLDPATTILVGKLQPWSPYAPDRRAIGYINHPMHMITPHRAASGIDDESFKGNDATLSSQIEHVISQYIPYGNRFDQSVSNVERIERSGRQWYQITTDRQVFFARKVVSALGIGPHQNMRNSFAPSGTDVAETGKTDETDRVVQDPAEHQRRDRDKVMDMDAFHRVVGRTSSWISRLAEQQGKVVVGVSGPNAGVDAVKSATDRGYEVKWFVASRGPAIVEGMANKISRPDLVTLYFGYASSWKHLDDGRIEVESANLKPPVGGKGSHGFAHIAQAADNPVEVDCLVYAPGPDVGKVEAPFASMTGSLIAHEEGIDKRFDAAATYDVKQSGIEESNINIKDSIWRRIQSVAPRGEDEAPTGTLYENLLHSVQEILGTSIFASPASGTGSKRKSPALSIGTEDRSLLIIGGQAHRMRVSRTGLREEPIKREDPNEVEPEEGKDFRRLISETLPPTDIIDDQLTPIRSQMEAMANFMPGYIGMDTSNLSTDDRAMIVAQLGGYYANIPPDLANAIAQTIIRERRDGESRVRPGTENGAGAFNKRWTEKLDRLQQLFASDNIKALRKSST